MRKLPVALIALTLIALGCSKPEDKFVGSYTGTVKPSEQMMQAIDMGVAAGSEPAIQAKSEIGNAQYELELKSDGTYVSSSEGISSTGEWSLDEEIGRITLTISEESKQQAKERSSQIADPSNDSVLDALKELDDVVLNVSEDGNSLSFSLAEMFQQLDKDPTNGMFTKDGIDIVVSYTKSG